MLCVDENKNQNDNDDNNNPSAAFKIFARTLFVDTRLYITYARTTLDPDKELDKSYHLHFWSRKSVPFLFLPLPFFD